MTRSLVRRLALLALVFGLGCADASPVVSLDARADLGVDRPSGEVADAVADDVFDAPRPAHPDDASAFGGHWYRYYAATLRWPEARARCEALGATLACIASAEENAFVATLAPTGPIDGAQRPWLGGTNEARVDVWAWIDGSPWRYERWVPGQPDNPAVERWLKMNPDGAWDDATFPSSYVCEWTR